MSFNGSRRLQKIIADGPPRAVQKNPEVTAAYLGTDWQA